MAAPAVPTVQVENRGVGVVRVRVMQTDGDFYRIYRGTSHAPTALQIDDVDGGVWYTDTVTEDTTYYYRARGINIEVVDEEPVEVVSAYGADKAIHTINDSDVNDPDAPTGALLANRHRIAGGG